MRVESFLLESARRYPEKTALISAGARLTFADLKQKSLALAAQLRKQGVSRGDRVVVFLQNSPEAIVAVFATLLAGGVFSVINPGTKAAKLA